MLLRTTPSKILKEFSPPLQRRGILAVELFYRIYKKLVIARSEATKQSLHFQSLHRFKPYRFLKPIRFSFTLSSDFDTIERDCFASLAMANIEKPTKNLAQIAVKILF